MKAQGATEYLVQIGVVLLIALFVIGILTFPIESTQDVKKEQAGIQYKIAAMEYPDLLNGLVAYWKFDEGSGSSAADSRGNNACTFGAGNSTRMPAWTENGKSGYALVFDGNDDYLTCGTGVSLPNARTVVAWIKTGSASGSGRTIIDKGTQYWVRANYYSYNYAYWGADSGAWRSYSASGPNSQTWQHVAYVEDVSWDLPKIYVNGTEIAFSGNSTREQNAVSTGTIYIGTYGNSAAGTYNFNGTIDEIMIFNRALTQGEIRLLYENPGYPQ